MHPYRLTRPKLGRNPQVLHTRVGETSPLRGPHALARLQNAFTNELRAIVARGPDPPGNKRRLARRVAPASRRE
jgi:hypothetical protein